MWKMGMLASRIAISIPIERGTRLFSRLQLHILTPGPVTQSLVREIGEETKYFLLPALLGSN